MDFSLLTYLTGNMGCGNQIAPLIRSGIRADRAMLRECTKLFWAMASAELEDRIRSSFAKESSGQEKLIALLTATMMSIQGRDGIDD